MTTQLKRMTGQVKAVAIDDAGPGYLEGYANVIGVVDSHDEMTTPGAFVQDIPEFVAKGYMLPDHEWEIQCAIGYIVDAKEDPNGLWFRAEFHSDQKSQDIRKKVSERLAAGKEIGLSIGYWVIESETTEVDGKTVRLLNRVKVKEVSLVVAQANEPSTVTDSKSHIPYQEQLESVKGSLSDLIGRVESINDLGRGESWKQARVAELRDLGSLAHQLADRLERQEEQPEPPAPQVERRQVALALMRRAGITVTTP